MTAKTLSVVTPATSSALERSVSDYLASAAARGLSPRTIDGYSWVLGPGDPACSWPPRELTPPRASRSGSSTG